MIVTAPHDAALNGSVIFLAGPIQGVHSWQDEAAALLQALNSEVHVATPRRPWDNKADFDDADYRQQVDWETRWLRRAGQHGVVLFWLARDRFHRCERAHAQTTRFELAEWKERHRVEGCHLVVGIEEGSSGARYIRHRFAAECPRVPIRDALADTCRAALELVQPFFMTLA
ncbi:MAG: hypothetical protein FJX76_06240 [Armatimonadetes bacterium]|nr:hypothetical protein [Armatimonadota bacterium]